MREGGELNRCYIEFVVSQSNLPEYHNLVFHLFRLLFCDILSSSYLRDFSFSIYHFLVYIISNSKSYILVYSSPSTA